MEFSIDKDTDLYCSFAAKAGSAGCRFHNAGFQKLGINAIYKSFSITDITVAIQAVRELGIKGCAVTMPFKQAALALVDSVERECAEIGATNTILNDGGVLVAHNTDWMAAREVLGEFPQHRRLYVLGDGGYAAAVRHAARRLGFEKIDTIKRADWERIPEFRDALVFNCTPVEDVRVDSSVDYIDCVLSSESGRNLAGIQARYQFELYTGQRYPD